MEKVTTQSSEEIIRKSKLAIENLPDEDEVSESIKRLSEPFGHVEEGEDSEASFEVNGGKLEIKYSLVEAHLTETLSDYIEHEKHGKRISDESQSAKIINWKRVTRLRYTKEGKTYNLLTLCPDSYNIFFCPDETEIEGVLMNGKNILIRGDINTPKALVTVLHEVGHIWDNLKLKVMGKRHLVDSHEYSDLAEDLRKERAASAYALRILRPFLKDDEQKSDVINFLKHYALLSYHLDTVNKIDNYESLKSSMSRDVDWYTTSEDEDEFEYYYNGFEKWRHTAKYTELKKEFNPKELSDDEFWLWREWVEKTGYEFWNDLTDYEG